MIMFRKIYGFFLSLGTSIWLLALMIALFFAGAFIMPLKKEFQAIHSMPLIDWLKAQPISVTWWLWGTIGLLVFLTLNTLFCSIDSVIKKRSTTQWLLLISPQIIHIGFLFILLAHMFSSLGGFKGGAVAYEGSFLRLPNDVTVEIAEISVRTSPSGFLSDLEVNINYFVDDRIIKDTIRFNAPSFYKGFGICLKDARTYPYKAALLEVSREPGALWALIGGIVFMLGTVTLLILKIKKES